jgi:hypothetical protein
MLTFIKVYTLACMEHAHHVPSTKPGALTLPSKLAFAHMFQANIDHYVVLHGVRNENVRQKLAKDLDRVQGGAI